MGANMEALVALLQRHQSVLQALAEGCRAFREFIPQDDLDHLEPDGRRQGVGGMSRIE